MADAEHVAVAKGGPAAVAEWNHSHRGQGLDLSGSDLRHIVLGRSDLRRADLRDSILDSANLVECNLRMACLDNASLRCAYLRESNLRDASLRCCNLEGANLTGCVLFGSDLSHANVSGARFPRAAMWGTRFLDIDLSGALRLDASEHFGPSFIDEDTRRNSGGRVPDAFWRQCGSIPEAARTHHVFVHVDATDLERAKPVVQAVASTGGLVWTIPRGFHTRRLDGILPPYAPVSAPLAFVIVSPPQGAADVWSAPEKSRVRQIARDNDAARWIVVLPSHGNDSARIEHMDERVIDVRNQDLPAYVARWSLPGY